MIASDVRVYQTIRAPPALLAVAQHMMLCRPGECMQSAMPHLSCACCRAELCCTLCLHHDVDCRL